MDISHSSVSSYILHPAFKKTDALKNLEVQERVNAAITYMEPGHGFIFDRHWDPSRQKKSGIYEYEASIVKIAKIITILIPIPYNGRKTQKIIHVIRQTLPKSGAGLVFKLNNIYLIKVNLFFGRVCF
ncbi:hypothetical protein CEXT_604631 [Caerostris extrusa]|uniref:Uncharacterized protein n=1 Tax=Caerostris extrusa TaxID=172846 RepID=A0AAV4QL68_CAEEX|nr:hypothetical protein CEXT_604631 [Caerostris extrusa]